MRHAARCHAANRPAPAGTAKRGIARQPKKRGARAVLRPA